MQNNNLVKLAQSFKKKTKTRDLVPLYEYAKNENALEINWKDQPWSDVQSNARKSYWYNY